MDKILLILYLEVCLFTHFKSATSTWPSGPPFHICQLHNVNFVIRWRPSMRNPRVCLFIVCFLQCRLLRGEFTLQSTNCTWCNVLLHLRKIRKKLCEFINELRCRLMFITRGAGPLLAIRRSTLLRHSHIDTSSAIKKGCA